MDCKKSGPKVIRIMFIFYLSLPHTLIKTNQCTVNRTWLFYKTWLYHRYYIPPRDWKRGHVRPILQLFALRALRVTVVSRYPGAVLGLWSKESAYK